MRFPLLAAAAGCLATTLPLAAQDYRSWLRARYPDFARVTVQAALQEALQQGLIRSPAERLAFKNAFYALREDKAAPALAAPFLRDYPAPAGPAQVPENAVFETEFNDSIAYADAFGAASCVSGSSLNNDADYYAIVSTGEYVTAEVMGRGAVPMSDSLLGLRTRQGHLLSFSEDIGGGNLLSRISAYLPTGIYYFEVGSFTGGGGDYDLVLTRDPVNLVPLTTAGPNSGTTAPPGGGTQTVFTFTLSGDTRVDSVVLGGGADPAVTVQLADGRVWFTNDDSERFGLDPSFDLDLPAGSYTVHVSDVAGGAIPFTINHSETATTIAELCSAGTATGFVNGRETRNLYRLAVPAGRTVTLDTAPGPSSPIGDTILYLFDAELSYHVDVDDDTAMDFYSRIVTGLPAGLYLVGARGWDISSGDYNVTAACNQPFPSTPSVRYGRNALQAPGGGQVNLALLDVCTDTAVRLDSIAGSSSGFYAVMDGNGLSAGVSEWTTVGSRVGPSGRHRDRHAGVDLARGAHYVMTWNRFAPSTPVTLDIRPPLECDLAGNLVSHAKAGDTALLFADLATGPGFNFGLGDNGFFCLAFPSATLITVGVAPVPASGRVLWGPCPTPAIPVFIQQGDLHTSTQWAASPGLATWRNLNRL